MKQVYLIFSCLWLAVGNVTGQTSQSYTMRGLVFSNGSASMTGQSFQLKATIGQTLAGRSSSNSYSAATGFEPGANVTGVRLPDLKFKQNPAPGVNPTTVAPGNKTSATFTIKNFGDADAIGNVIVKIFLSVNTSYEPADTEIISLDIVTGLAAGEEFSFPGATQSGEVTIPESTAIGAYQVLFSIDPENNIVEKDETAADNIFSVPITVSNSVGSDNTPPVITPGSNGIFRAGTNVSVDVADAISGVKSVVFYHRPVTGESFTPSSMEVAESSYIVSMEEEWADPIGMEGYFIADDHALNKTAKPVNNIMWYRLPDHNNTVPFAGDFNGKRNTYQMFSIPYNPDDDDIADIFETVLNGHDPVNWRLFHYKDGAYTEYPQQFRKIVLGEAYWFNTVIKDFEIKPGSSKMYPASQTGPFPLSLAAGWNQIGNPYPFNLDWNTVVGANDKVGPLWFFSNGAYSKSNIFKPWTGAFVHADEAMTLPIPVLAKTTASGRTSDHAPEPDVDAEAWILPVTLRINDLQQVSGVGMHPEAKPSKDKFDEITLPRFLDYVEMNTYHEEFFSPNFSTDVVPTNEEQVWIFDMKSNLDDQRGELIWDHHLIAANKSSLILIDLLDGRWVDMKTTGSYSFTHKQGRQFRISYNREGEIKPGMTLLGDAYPNPFTTELTIPILVDQPGYQQIGIYDVLGRKIRTLMKDFSQPGLQEIKWDSKDDGGNEINKGLLLYRIEDKTYRQVKRIIKI